MTYFPTPTNGDAIWTTIDSGAITPANFPAQGADCQAGGDYVLQECIPLGVLRLLMNVTYATTPHGFLSGVATGLIPFANRPLSYVNFQHTGDIQVFSNGDVIIARDDVTHSGWFAAAVWESSL